MVNGTSIFLLLLLPLLSWARTESPDTVSLREVEVATRRRLSDTGIEKTIVDSAALRRDVSLSLADVLSANTTLFIKSYGRATEATAEFRGTSPSHTQVLWNGMKINSPMLGTVDFSYIPSYFVDQATLLHGASSINLTGGGLGGAVDLATSPCFNQGKEFHYVQGIGSYHTFDQFLGFSFSNSHWSSSTRLSYAHSKNDFSYVNYDKKVDERDAQGNITRSYHPKETNKSGYFDDINAMQNVTYRDDRGNLLGASLWYAHSLRGLPFLSVDYKDDADFTNEHLQQTWRGVLSWDHYASLWKLTTKAGYSHEDIAYDYSTQREAYQTDITHSRSYSQTAFLQADIDYFPTARWLLQAHVATRYVHVRSSDRSPFHIGDNYCLGRPEYEVSASAKWRPVDQLSLSVVLRQEGYKRDVVPLIPAAFLDVVICRPINLVFKASVARNYRYPTMNDLYFRPGGNADLLPEKGFTYDAGLEWDIARPGLRLKGNITAFDSHIRDWILWTPNTKGFWQPSNVRRVHNYGVETMLNAEVRLSRTWKLNLTANYAHTPSINRGEALNSNDASYGKQLCYVPRNSANLSGRLSWRSWGLTYSWIYYSRRFTTTSNEPQYISGSIMPYYMSNAMLEKSFTFRRRSPSSHPITSDPSPLTSHPSPLTSHPSPLTSHPSPLTSHPISLTLKASVNNLLGTEYVTVLSHPMPTRNFEFFAELKF